MTLALALLLATTGSPAVPPWAPSTVGAIPHLARARADGVTGTWDGLYEPPGTVGGQSMAFVLRLAADGSVGGRISVREGFFELQGSFDAARSQMALHGERAGGPSIDIELTLAGEVLSGRAVYAGMSVPIEVRRTSTELLERDLRPPVLVIDRERPADFSLVGLPDELGFAVDDLVLAFCEEHGVVGLSLGIVLGGELVDVRSLGWQDLAEDVPASGDTQYRWASISKPLTAVTAVLMADAGSLDLEADVRVLVPEFPKKQGVVTPLALLGHLAGVTHYQDALRTPATYSAPHPFEDRIVALDIFKDTPLLAPPGTLYGYSTHGYALLGAVMQRAGKQPYEQLVAERVLVPLGMRSTFPDFPSRPIPQRTRGYQVVEGGVVDSGDDDVSWKLPGGGWTSTVGDLGRFAAGLLGTGLLSDAQKRRMWTARTTSQGEPTGYGLGFQVGELGGRRLVSHGGSQRKVRTSLQLLPDDGLAVAVMCNTEDVPVAGLGEELLRLLAR